MRIKNIDQSGISKIKIVLKGRAIFISCQHMLINRFLPFFGRCQYKWLGDQYRLHALRRKIGDHFLRLWEIVLIKCQIPHGTFDVFAKPIQIENNRIDRNLFGFEFL